MTEVDQESFSQDELDKWILQANPLPSKTASLRDVVQEFETKSYCDRQFALLQSQTPMSTLSLRFSGPHEEAFAAATEASSVLRLRWTFFLAALVFIAFRVYDTFIQQNRSSALSLSLDYAIALPSFVVGAIATFPSCRPRVSQDIVTCVVFGTVALVLIVQKLIHQRQGPVLELMLLLIPIFGITRMRFIYSAALGSAIVGVYLTIHVTAAYVVPGSDTPHAVVYQTFNYAIRVLGGLVSHYRQELLRRRNFALQLPFQGILPDPTTNATPSTDATHARALARYGRQLHGVHLRFRNRQVEASFVQFWYLIDPFPFENIHNPVLHHGTAHVLRSALVSVVLTQCLLGVQDMKLLPRALVLPALTARFAVVVPAYVGMVALIYVLSRRFASRAASSSSFDAFAHRRQEHAALQGYVPMAQVAAGVVVSVHIAAMAGFVFAVFAATDDTTLADLYFMGLLNAVLFVHRSGFRVRFEVAAASTSLLTVPFLVAVFAMLPVAVAAEYAMYVVVVVGLGCVTSHEEEALRRQFFVIKSIRTLEFQRWLKALVRVQTWMRVKLTRRLRLVRVAGAAHSASDLNQHVPAQLAAATKAGLVGQVVEAIASVV